MNNTTSKDDKKLASWVCLTIYLILAVWVFITAVKTGNIGLVLVGSGFGLMGVASFRHPISFTKPLSALFRNSHPKMDAKTALISLLGVVLIFLGALFHWIL